MIQEKEFITLIEEIIESDSGTIGGAEPLESLDGWDSVAVISFIALVDERLGITLSPKKIADAKTVLDLARLLGEK
jgi:acyl carrier protein